MKYASLGLSAAALILSVIAFSKIPSTKAIETPTVEKTEGDLVPTSLQVAEGGLKIAYIDIDTLVSNYDQHKKLRDKLERKVERAEREFEKRVKGFEDNVKFFESQADKLSPAELERAQMELGGMQQEIMQLRDQKMQELIDEETKLNKQVKDEVDEMVRVIANELVLDFVFFKEASGVMVHGNNNFDITALVTKRLNEKQRDEDKK
ncbi:MAG: OmpH family outer membrane protein [Schleiferiaceae bacterium]|nr:OmpH family outer membrane protein [Schleiferiaceae bacterium]